MLKEPNYNGRQSNCFLVSHPAHGTYVLTPLIQPFSPSMVKYIHLSLKLNVNNK